MDPELAALVPLLPAVDLTDLASTRAMLAALAAGAGEAPAGEDLVVSDVQVPGPSGAPPVPVRIFRPAGDGIRPALVYFHGGAFVLGEVRLFDQLCRDYAAHAAVVVVSVDYRLAPEDPFPAAVDDGYAALAWTTTTGMRARPLRDEGIVYALRLLQAGVAVELHNVAGTFHSFDAFPVALSRAVMAEQHAALRRALHAG